MSSPYIPATDAGLSAWSANFSNLITLGPATYGLTVTDANTIAAADLAFQDAYTLAIDPSTRTSATIAAKNAAKSSLLAVVRPYAQQIKNNAGVSNEAKVGLGLNIPDPSRSPVPPPTTNPILGIIGATPLVHTLRFSDVNTPGSRRKPAGVKFLFVFRTVGTTPTTDPDAAPFLNAVTTQPFASDFSSGDVGKVATYFGQWSNARGQRGPWSAPVHLTIV